MKQLFKKVTSILLLMIAITSCSKDSNTKQFDELKALKETQLLNLYDNEISNLNSKFIIAATVLNESVENFNQETSIQNLEIAQQKWIDMTLVWKKLELYKIGSVPDNHIFHKIDYWPTETNFINNFINGSDTLDESFIESKGSSSKGVAAIEFLLFKTTNQLTLDSFTTETNFERRKAYLVALCQNLKNKSIELELRWMDYKPTFITSLESGLDGSQDQIVNAIVSLLEKIKISKLEKPLGTNNNDFLKPLKLEAHRSGKSLEIIRANLVTLERCFNGDFSTSTDIGFDDYLIKLGRQDLATQIANDFTNCFNKLDVINPPLREDLFNNTQNVNALKDAVKTLLMHIKVDMSSALNTIITFNENDGD